MSGKKNTSKLVLRPITDKNGVRRMTWVKPNGEQNKKQKNGKQEEQRNGGTKEDSSKVQNLGRDAIADRGRTKSEKDSSRKAAKEKLTELIAYADDIEQVLDEVQTTGSKYLASFLEPNSSLQIELTDLGEKQHIDQQQTLTEQKKQIIQFTRMNH